MTAKTKRIVRLYTLSTCPLCKRVKRTLRDLGVEFEFTDVDLLVGGEQWVITKEVKKYNPDATYPTMIIEEVVKDFSEEHLKERLGL